MPSTKSASGTASQSHDQPTKISGPLTNAPTPPRTMSVAAT
jgi:hypothetical protein